MATTTNFRILGADGREYGPVAIEIVKRWIAEGRALASTLARAEDQDSWRPLSAYAELAGDLAGGAAGAEPPPVVPPVAGGAPALAGGAPAQVDARKSKIVAGILGIVVGGFGVHRFYLGYFGVAILQLSLTLVSWIFVPIVTFSGIFRHDATFIAAMILGLAAGIAHCWGFIEGVLILCGVAIKTDARGVALKD